MKRNLPLTAVFVIYLLTALTAHSSQTTGFTYQGKLLEQAVPATGVYEMEFRMFDQETDGTQQGSTINKAQVAVTNGLFTIELDFGETPFSGAPRWLEVSVRRAGAAGNFAVLSPRQSVSPAPYAVYALSAGRVNGIITDSQLSSNVALLDRDQTFTGTTHFASASGSFSGNGAGLTNLSISATGGAGVMTGRINQLPGSPRICYAVPAGVSDAVDSERSCTTLSPNQEVTACNFSVKLTTAPGTGKSVTFILRIDGNDTPLSIRMSGSETSGNSGLASVTIPAGSELSIRVQIEGMSSSDSALFGWAVK